MTAPDAFEQDFVGALFADGADGAGAPGWTAQPGFAVYRNTVRKGCIDALEANFPAVARLVGRDWLRAAAARHLAGHPPRDPCLLRYGEGFADTLAELAGDELPYLHGVAALDRLWTASHTAADAPVLRADALAGLPPETLATLRLPPHPAARWHGSGTLPLHSIWSANRSGDAAALEALAALAWAGESTLLTRPIAEVIWQPLPAGGCAFLDACARGDRLADAAAAALDAHPHIDLAALLAQLLQAGTFTTSTGSSP
ncbi:MAG: putative DNA-binding domain-containing protein [Pseudomonadota bacterium]|nr:putative DNA-binding domain-containing protein [Pseudomonadota bacterium]